MLAAMGIVIDRATLALWVGYAATELAPVVTPAPDLLGSVKLAVDETPVPVLDPGRGRTKTGYFWVTARDDRAWGGLDPPAVAYSYAPRRGAAPTMPSGCSRAIEASCSATATNIVTGLVDDSPL